MLGFENLGFRIVLGFRAGLGLSWVVLGALVGTLNGDSCSLRRQRRGYIGPVAGIQGL